MQERPCRKERGERTLAGGPWGGAMWCWIKNQRCVHTTDGAGTRRRPVSQAQINGKNWKLAQPHTSGFSLRYGTPDWAKAGRTVCVCGCFKGLWDFNEDIKSLLCIYSKVCITFE